MPNWITLNWFLMIWQTSNQKINMICPNIVYFIEWCHGIPIIHKPLYFLRQHLRHIITYSWYIHTLQYPYHATLLTEPVTLHHHQMANHCQQASHLQEILCHTTTHPNRYHTYQLTLIQTQVFQIILRWTHLTQTTGILNKDNQRVRNFRLKGVTMNLFKSTPILQPSYLNLHKIPRLWGLNYMSILYSAGFNYWISLIYL